MNVHFETASVSYSTYKCKLGYLWNAGSVIRIRFCVSNRKLLKIYSFTEVHMFAVIPCSIDSYIIEQLCSELFIYWLRDILHKQDSGRWMYCCDQDNKVCELATVSLPWQHWTKALVWFDDFDVSAFHSCVVVHLWQSLSEWHLLLPACFVVPPRECCSLN